MPATPEAKHTKTQIRQLVQQGSDLRHKAETGADFKGKQQWLAHPPVLPAPVARLTRCLLDGVEVEPETLTNALQLVAFFAQGCRSKDDWRTLSAGPYGEALMLQAWLLCEAIPPDQDTWHRNTCAVLAAFRHRHLYGFNQEGQEKLRESIVSAVREEAAFGLMTCAGMLWMSARTGSDEAHFMPLEAVESRLFSDDIALCDTAIWAWASIHRERRSPPHASPETLDRLTALWLGATASRQAFSGAAYALCQHIGMPRDAWAPQLTGEQVGQVRAAGSAQGRDPDTQINLRAALMIGFHGRNVWPDQELARLLLDSGKQPPIYIRGVEEDRSRLLRTLEQLSSS